jgi:pyridoxamine 5'-phosphate oxidase
MLGLLKEDHMPELTFPPLIEKGLDPNPIVRFQRWFDEAVAAKIPQAESMALATATAGGKPSVRMVLLKSFDENGFVFYTNHNSQKGKELAENPRAALVFHWDDLHRQVRIEGTVSKVSPEESDAYFQTRPRESQISAWASQQSNVIGSRAELDRRFEELQKKYEGKPIPRPPHWGGYRLKPTRIEFWQARYARLNDRILGELQKDGNWAMKRLAP